MPLIKSSSPEAISANISTERHHGKPEAQAIAIAMETARRAKARKRADGGRVHVGPIVSTVAGRTDHHPLDVPPGAYVVPAHVVSGLGQGNTLAGMEVLKHMYPEPSRSSGGRAPSSGKPVQIMAAGGEVVISPEQIIARHGTLEHGHAVLDKFVKDQTKHLAKTISKLPGPAKD